MKEPPKSRYINNLKQTAQVREITNQRVYDRRLLKERESEDGQFDDKEQFITGAYKQKLEMQRKWEFEVRSYLPEYLLIDDDDDDDDG